MAGAGYDISLAGSSSSGAALSGAQGAQSGSFQFGSRGAGALIIQQDQKLAWLILAAIAAYVIVHWLWRKG